jgi:hypothetical protein
MSRAAEGRLLGSDTATRKERNMGYETIDDEDDGTHLGAKFWLMIIGGTIGLAIAALIFFLFIDVIWYAWGFVGALLVVFLVVGAIGYIHDRRAQKRYEELPA